MLIAVLHISGLLIYLELKIKNSFLKIIKKLMILQWFFDILSWIVFHPLKLRTFQQLSFCADQWGRITAVIHFLKISRRHIMSSCYVFIYLGFTVCVLLYWPRKVCVLEWRVYSLRHQIVCVLCSDLEKYIPNLSVLNIDPLQSAVNPDQVCFQPLVQLDHQILSRYREFQ